MHRTIVTLIPTHRNDDSEVGKDEIDAILETLYIQFGGVTVEGVVEGHWLDPDNGQHYGDTCWKVKIAIEESRMDEAIEAIKLIGRQLDQLAMYFEIQNNEVRFIKP